MLDKLYPMDISIPCVMEHPDSVLNLLAAAPNQMLNEPTRSLDREDMVIAFGEFRQVEFMNDVVEFLDWVVRVFHNHFR